MKLTVLLCGGVITCSLFVQASCDVTLPPAAPAVRRGDVEPSGSDLAEGTVRRRTGRPSKVTASLLLLHTMII